MRLESIDYEVFDHKQDADQALSLEDAVKQAGRLRRIDSKHFYRVNPTDLNMTAFRVEEISKQRAYIDALARWSNLLNKIIFRTREFDR